MTAKKKLESSLEEQLKVRNQNGVLRFLKQKHPSIDFASNDYLGLAQTPSLSSFEGEYHPGSRLISGNHPNHTALELWAANFWGTEASVFYPTGYMANVGLFSCLLKKGDTYLYDELIHASIRDGLRLSHAKAYSFCHNDLEDLEAKFNNATGNIVVVTESVFSMDGDLAPLDALSKWALEKGCDLIVDEAHATGVFGPQGRGLVDALGLRSQVLATIHTLGKGVGAHGALVVGSQVLKEYQINFSRPFIYSTAIPPHIALEIQNKLELMKNSEGSREVLAELCKHFEKQVDANNCRNLVPFTSSPIKTILLGDVNQVKELEKNLASQNIFCKAILSPTVAKGSERLRICLHAYNTKSQIDLLLQQLKKEVD